MSKYDRYLKYFKSMLPRPSFRLEKGEGAVMVSAPHAVEQFRAGRRKYAEPYTGVLARFIHDEMNVPVIYKTKNCHDDANRDDKSPYRDAIADHVRANGIKYLIDLHQMSAERAEQIDLGTGNGKNIEKDPMLLGIVKTAFSDRGFAPLTVEAHFPAVHPNTVCASTARECGIACIQIEINTKLLSNVYRGCRFTDVLGALKEIIEKLNCRALNDQRKDK